jgi:hypothetical protein
MRASKGGTVTPVATTSDFSLRTCGGSVGGNLVSPLWPGSAGQCGFARCGSADPPVEPGDDGVNSEGDGPGSKGDQTYDAGAGINSGNVGIARGQAGGILATFMTVAVRMRPR